MKIGLAQINTTVGDIAGNTARILSAYREASAAGASLVVTPELAITGYPPQDLVFKSRFVPLNMEALDSLEAQLLPSTSLLVGFVAPNPYPGNPFHNAAALLRHNTPRAIVHKSLLPTYDVFDEDRYFQPASHRIPVPFADTVLGISVCEDIWPREYLHRPLYEVEPLSELAQTGARVMINLSASPYHSGKPQQRHAMLSGLARHHGVPLIYCNAVGGNDQLVFDGYSTVIGADGAPIAVLPGFEESVQVVDLGSPASDVPRFLDPPEEIYRALCLGLRDYMRKCGFRTVVLGLSGGIDSALTACIAADAIGPENVTGVTMPSRYSSDGSVQDSVILAANLGINLLEIPIEQGFQAMSRQLTDALGAPPQGVTEENLQPRIRGLTLMALSNHFGHLVLTTGNKSELAVGYCTLYGDMCGGLAVISDLPKGTVYELSRWVNREREIIPTPTLTKPPSAELRPDQKDQDTLPPYDLLDAILELYVTQQITARDIIARGFDEATVRWIQRRVDLNEYKREQAAPGLRVTSKAFGAGRRMPIAQRFVD